MIRFLPDLSSRKFKLEVLAVVKAFFSKGVEESFSPSKEQYSHHNHEKEPFWTNHSYDSESQHHHNELWTRHLSNNHNNFRNTKKNMHKKKSIYSPISENYIASKCCVWTIKERYSVAFSEYSHRPHLPQVLQQKLWWPKVVTCKTTLLLLTSFIQSYKTKKKWKDIHYVSTFAGMKRRDQTRKGT